MATLIRFLLLIAIVWGILTAYKHCFQSHPPETIDLTHIPIITSAEAYDNPKYYNELVILTGQVKNSWYIGPLNIGGYEFTDETGTILIFKKGIPPVDGPNKLQILVEIKPVLRSNGNAFVTGTEIRVLSIGKPNSAPIFRRNPEYSTSSKPASRYNLERPALALSMLSSPAPQHRANVSTPTPISRPGNTQPTQFIFVNDISKSNYYLQVTPAQVHGLLDKYGRAGGVQMEGILIHSNSLAQQPVSSSFIRLDTQKVEGTWLIAKQIQKRNKARKAEFDKQVDQATNLIAKKILLPRNRKYSDVNAALRLAKIAAEQPNEKNFKIYLVINSDLLHDVPGQKPQLTPVVLPKQVEVILIGNAPEVDLKKLFPKNKITQLTSFQSLL